MDSKALNNSINMIRNFVDKNMISSAIMQITGILSIFPSLWSLRDKTERLETEYKYLKQYALDGAEDPTRPQMLNSIKENLLNILDELKRSILSLQENTLYYNSLRFMNLRGEESIGNALDGLRNRNFNSTQDRNQQKEIEQSEGNLFKKIWLTYPLKVYDKAQIRDAIIDSEIDARIKHLMIYATFLGVLEFYDPERLELLAEIYDSETDEELRVIALICLLLGLWSNTDRTGEKEEKIVEKLSGNKMFRTDLKKIMSAFLKAGDTERITKKMNEDIIPALTKLKPDIEKRMKDMKKLDPETDYSDFNPDWENLFEDAGVSEKIRELTELQSEGNDLLMVTFSHLKTFPFFNEISNWFIPFSKNHTELKRGKANDMIYDLLSESKFFCESDKYSMALSLGGIPEAQLNMFSEQIRFQSKEFDEIVKTSLEQESINRDLLITKTVQNLYRFFKLFRRKSEFNDPFKKFILLSELDLLKNICGDYESKKVTADFLFSRGYYDEAANLYDRLIETRVGEPELYQKAGYSYQKTGNHEAALKNYELSDLIDSENVWNLKRLGYCSRILGNANKALDYYKRLMELKQDDVSTILNAGYCEMELKNYDQALKLFYKADFLSEGSMKTMRPLAWCLLLLKDYEKAEKLYNQIEEAGCNEEDYLNLGHLMMIKKDYRKAINYYSATYKKNKELYMKDFDKDREVLTEAGVDPVIIDLVNESVIN